MLNLINRHRAFDGQVEFYSHLSESTQTEMRFSVFVPPQAEKQKVPVLYWLSGLTCTEENFTIKAGAQRWASKHGILLVAPDTSPRGEGVPGKSEAWDIGQGASFYVNATQEPWAKHYQMYDYVTLELSRVIHANFSTLPDRQSIFGHSMGGHGALVCALRNPGRYRSVSAFAPICAPTLVPWGRKAFGSYLGEDPKLWAAYDAHLLVQNKKYENPILIDQGTKDKFLVENLMPEKFQAACEKSGTSLQLRMQKGYDHSYYFISTFIEDHIGFHAKYLNGL